MNKIRELRAIRKMKQVELAIRTGIQPGLLCRYERGVPPSQRNAIRIANALGCAVEDVFPGYRTLRDY
jgi:transcriptional regulator with XRE-family HTH domain